MKSRDGASEIKPNSEGRSSSKNNDSKVQISRVKGNGRQ
jgi:hypothetical protein